METVKIPEDLFKIRYESIDNASIEEIMIVQVNDEVAVAVDEGYNPRSKPEISPPELDDILSDLRVDLVEPDEAPDYELEL